MQRPPRPPEAPLFGRRLWRRALLQGGVLSLMALLLVSWPGLELGLRRSLLFSLLLLGGGGLVMLNGAGISQLGQLGLLLALGLWLLLQTIPGLMPLLGMAPLLGSWSLPLLGLAGVLSLLAFRRRT